MRSENPHTNAIQVTHQYVNSDTGQFVHTFGA